MFEIIHFHSRIPQKYPIFATRKKQIKNDPRVKPSYSNHVSTFYIDPI